MSFSIKNKNNLLSFMEKCVILHLILLTYWIREWSNQFYWHIWKLTKRQFPNLPCPTLPKCFESHTAGSYSLSHFFLWNDYMAFRIIFFANGAIEVYQGEASCLRPFRTPAGTLCTRYWQSHGRAKQTLIQRVQNYEDFKIQRGFG